MKKVLVAPLNWGLGHATRCMPIIDELQKQGATVLLASDGASYQLLKKEYPHLPIFELPAYNIRYPFANMVLSMALQMPKILRGCLGEHFWLKKFLKKENIDILISDNRYGLYHKDVKSIFLTHQIHIQTPFSTLVNRINHYFIKQFDLCWIPDCAHDSYNLAGILAHGTMPKGIKIQYIGALSRFQKYALEKKYKAAIILSGPEPQRTYLESKIIEQLKKRVLEKSDIPPQYFLVRGVMTEEVYSVTLDNTIVHNYLTKNDLNQVICESDYVIARSGYSTLMDIAKLEANAIFIPTDGQTEQEYLAHTFMEKKVFFSQHQEDFDIETALAKSKEYTGIRNFYDNTPQLSEIISELLKF